MVLIGHTKKHKCTQTEESLDMKSIFYTKQYCEVCFVYMVCILRMLIIVKLTQTIPEKKVVLVHYMV